MLNLLRIKYSESSLKLNNTFSDDPSDPEITAVKIPLLSEPTGIPTPVVLCSPTGTPCTPTTTKEPVAPRTVPLNITEEPESTYQTAARAPASIVAAVPEGIKNIPYAPPLLATSTFTFLVVCQPASPAVVASVC